MILRFSRYFIRELYLSHMGKYIDIEYIFERERVALSGTQSSRFRGTTKVRNSGLGPDPDQSAKNGPE